MRRWIVWPVVFVSLWIPGAHGVSANQPAPYDPCLKAGIRETVVFIGTAAAPQTSVPVQAALGDSFAGTGFLIAVDDIFYVVTAKHVAAAIQEGGISKGQAVVAFNNRVGMPMLLSLADIERQFDVRWVLDPTADIAAHPFAIRQDYDVRVVPASSFLPDEALSELQDVFFVAYHPEVTYGAKVKPIFRRGMVSLIADRVVYLDAFVFPGNSGSPVYTKPSPVSFHDGGVVVGEATGCQLAGMIVAYVPYRDTAYSHQTQRPRVIFEENSGLAEMVPSSAIMAFTKSTVFQEQHRRIIKLYTSKP